MTKIKDVGGKVQTTVASYPYYVITSLIGIKGTNLSAVLDFIILDWIGKNQAELEGYEITFSGWKRSKRETGKRGRSILRLHDASRDQGRAGRRPGETL